MYTNYLKSPALIKIGRDILKNTDWILKDAHLFYSNKILVTQGYLFDEYKALLNVNEFSQVIIVKGGEAQEAKSVASQMKGVDCILLGFGGGSVIDLVKYVGTQCDIPFITIPTTLSNDSMCSGVARLTDGVKKRSFPVQSPLGILVDFGVVSRAPKKLTMAGIADLVSNLSAVKDWRLANKNIGEPIDELALMFAKAAPEALFAYYEKNIVEDRFLYDLSSGLILSGMSMMVTGTSRGASGSEHLISHAIDEYFPARSSIHGLQVGWAHLLVEKLCRKDEQEYKRLKKFYDRIGVLDAIEDNVKWKEKEFAGLIPYAKTIRQRYTIFDVVDLQNQKK